MSKPRQSHAMKFLGIDKYWDEGNKTSTEAVQREYGTDKIVRRCPYPKLSNGHMMRPFKRVQVRLLRTIESGDAEGDYEAGSLADLEITPTGVMRLVKGCTCFEIDAKEGVDFEVI